MSTFSVVRVNHTGIGQRMQAQLIQAIQRIRAMQCTAKAHANSAANASNTISAHTTNSNSNANNINGALYARMHKIQLAGFSKYMQHR